MAESAVSQVGAALDLRHYSHRPIDRLLPKDQEGPAGYGKPRGLWVSVEGNGDGWREWCEAESFSGGWTHVYRVALTDDANVLHVASVWALDQFHREWADNIAPYPGSSYRKLCIDWRAVADQYDGIIIAPYQWSRRLDGEVSEWYYGWDCASGCIWEPRAIASLELISLGVPPDSEVSRGSRADTPSPEPGR